MNNCPILGFSDCLHFAGPHFCARAGSVAPKKGLQGCTVKSSSSSSSSVGTLKTFVQDAYLIVLDIIDLLRAEQTMGQVAAKIGPYIE